MEAISALVVVRRALLAAAILVLSLAPVRAEGEFTGWMSLDDMNAHLEALDGDKPGGKNYWDRGNWITAVEGRWEAGSPQYRVSYGAVPPRRAYWWYWYINQDKESFDKKVHSLADEGFKLVHFNSYVRPGGGERFQGVWHKFIPADGLPPLPPGTYKLSELRGKLLDSDSMTIAIDGTKLSGRGPACTFKGSVRERFSGSMDISRIGENPGRLTQLESQQERDFLECLENASWFEQEGRLRVVKEGRTVLRFEPFKEAVEAK